MKKNYIIATVAVALIGIGVCSYLGIKKSKSYDINEVFVVEVLGCNGYGYANVKVNPDFIEKSGLDIEIFSYEINKTNMISNGDVISVKITDKANVQINEDIYVYLVDGLNEGTELDVFKDLTISHDSQTGKVILDNSLCSEFVKENVIFSVNREKDSYDVGEVVEIIAYVDENAAADNGYIITKTSYEYIVE